MFTGMLKFLIKFTFSFIISFLIMAIPMSGDEKVFHKIDTLAEPHMETLFTLAVEYAEMGSEKVATYFNNAEPSDAVVESAKEKAKGKKAEVQEVLKKAKGKLKEDQKKDLLNQESSKKQQEVYSHEEKKQLESLMKNSEV